MAVGKSLASCRIITFSIVGILILIFKLLADSNHMYDIYTTHQVENGKNYHSGYFIPNVFCDLNNITYIGNNTFNYTVSTTVSFNSSFTKIFQTEQEIYDYQNNILKQHKFACFYNSIPYVQRGQEKYKITNLQLAFIEDYKGDILTTLNSSINSNYILFPILSTIALLCNITFMMDAKRNYVLASYMFCFTLLFIVNYYGLKYSIEYFFDSCEFLKMGKVLSPEAYYDIKSFSHSKIADYYYYIVIPISIDIALLIWFLRKSKKTPESKVIELELL